MAQPLQQQKHHVVAPEARVYLGGQSHGFRPGEPFLLHPEHVEGMRAAGVRLDPHQAEAQAPTERPDPPRG